MSYYLGIELGSTRIKAVAVDSSGKEAASGDFNWENRLEDGIWTYPLSEAWRGLRECISKLADDFRQRNNDASDILSDIGCIGISAMMHGYLVFDSKGGQLVPFRTWRNTITEESAKILSDTFNFNIPQRWCIAHLHRAVSAKEEHVNEIEYLTTLAGYIHFELTGEKVAGVGEASGIFPIDSNTGNYYENMLDSFDNLCKDYDVPWKVRDILPRVLKAGDNAGVLTSKGARLLDETGKLKPGVPLCPPEGDAGTGMVATNAVLPRTGNVSAGTSVFAMLVLDKMPQAHPQIDMVTTPDGKPVAMVHAANCTADLDAWVSFISDAMKLAGDTETDSNKLYSTLYNAALRGDSDCGGIVSVGYLSGEHLTDFEEGRPLMLRTPNCRFTVENFMRSLLYSAIATLRIGMDILTADKSIQITKMLAHGGLFKTPGVAQRLLAGALKLPVAVMDSAGEGGAWGIALLAAYSILKEEGETLPDFLADKIFADSPVKIIEPEQSDIDGFEAYLELFKRALEVECTAVEKI